MTPKSNSNTIVQSTGTKSNETQAEEREEMCGHLCLIPTATVSATDVTQTLFSSFGAIKHRGMSTEPDFTPQLCRSYQLWKWVFSILFSTRVIHRAEGLENQWR